MSDASNFVGEAEYEGRRQELANEVRSRQNALTRWQQSNPNTLVPPTLTQALEEARAQLKALDDEYRQNLMDRLRYHEEALNMYRDQWGDDNVPIEYARNIQSALTDLLEFDTARSPRPPSATSSPTPAPPAPTASPSLPPPRSPVDLNMTEDLSRLLADITAGNFQPPATSSPIPPAMSPLPPSPPAVSPSTPRSTRGRRNSPQSNVSSPGLPPRSSGPGVGWDRRPPPPSANVSSLERYVEQMENMLYSNPGQRRTLSAQQVATMQARIQETEDRIRELLGYRTGGVRTTTRRLRGANQETDTATEREDLGQGDHRTTTTTRTTTTVRRGQRPVSRRESQSVSTPLSRNSSNTSGRSNRSRQSGTGRKNDVEAYIQQLKKQFKKEKYGHLGTSKKGKTTATRI